MRECITITAKISFVADAKHDAAHQEKLAGCWLETLKRLPTDDEMEFVSYKITRHQGEAEIYSDVILAKAPMYIESGDDLIALDVGAASLLLNAGISPVLLGLDARADDDLPFLVFQSKGDSK